MEKTMVGGLVDFKENLIFEEYKDQPLRGARRFKADMLAKYKIQISSDLYSRLINYQISKYGMPVVPGNKIAYVKNVEKKSGKCRRHNNERLRDDWEFKKFMRRNNEGNGIK